MSHTPATHPRQFLIDRADNEKSPAAATDRARSVDA